jgi:DHA2 family multidrug resistance protein
MRAQLNPAPKVRKNRFKCSPTSSEDRCLLCSSRHLLLSIALYAAGAIGCFSSAHSPKSLLISRVIMGFGGGALLVRTLILARLMFLGKTRIFALSLFYLELYSSEIFYPTAMGWISDTLRWNYAFLLDFPFLAIGAYLIWETPLA